MPATVESTPRRKAASAAADAPAVIVLNAPAGYGKGTFLREFAALTGALIQCDISSDRVSDVSRIVLDALVARDQRRAARSAADRLTQTAELAAATSREALRAEWGLAEGPEVFVLRDVCGRLSSPAGADLLSELIAALPPSRTLVLSTRHSFPPSLQQIVARVRSMTIGTSDLALSAAEVVDLAKAAHLRLKAAQAIHEIGCGWPLVTRLLVRLAERDSVSEIVDAARELRGPRLLTFTAHRTIARLDDLTRNALVVAVLLKGATHLQIVRVLGGEYDDLVFARLCDLPCIVTEGDRAVVHPEIAEVLRERFPALFNRLFDRTLHVLAGEGAYVEAAEVALDRGDVSRAAAIIDAAPPYTVAAVPLAAYQRIIERIDRTLIARYPNLWIATIPFRAFAVDRATFLREAETVYFCLPSAASSDQRATALMHLASAYLNVGRTEESSSLVEEALNGFARADSPARGSLLNYSASVHGMEGRFGRARQLAREASQISLDRFGENQTLHYIDVHEAAYRGQNDRVVIIVDELLRRLENEHLPVHRAHTATNGALFTWANGDDASFQRYLGILEEALTPGLDRGFRPMIDAARGLSMQLDWDYPWPVIAAVSQLYRLGVASNPDDAIDAAREAARAADLKRDPYTQILAHAALYVLDEASRENASAILASIAAGVESGEMREAIDNLICGGDPGILTPFIKKRVLRERSRTAPRMRLELLAGKFVQDERPLRLSEKEFELVALLGSSHGPLSRDRIGEMLWDHLAPEEWPNNLKVTLSRIRAKLGIREAIVAVDSRYRLSPTIDVDLRRAEMLVRRGGREGVDEGTREELRAIITSYHAGEGRYDRFHWAQTLIARITELACAAGLLLARHALSVKRYDDALKYANDVAAVDSFNEGASELMILVALARNDAAAARREYRRYSHALANEFGGQPSQRLTELVGNAR